MTFIINKLYKRDKYLIKGIIFIPVSSLAPSFGYLLSFRDFFVHLGFKLAIICF